jgi:phosphodiesterase/alkaline phosphatase D-like protein
VSKRFSLGAALIAALLAALVTASSALAAAPSATTGPTTSVGSGSATVTGTVNPGGQSTSWYVEYGTSSSYGSKTASASAGSGSNASSVSAELSGLKAGTTYHYRIVATNSAGTDRGSDAVFTTLVPPDVTTGSASAIGTTSATLNGAVDPNGRDTTFYFEYGTTSSYGTKTSAKSAGSATSAQSESAAITGLQSGRTYHFRIVASSDGGTSTGKDATFSTSSAPSVQTGDTASVTPTTATLKGAVTPNGLSTTWWFEYGTTTGYGTKTGSHSAGSGTKATSVSTGIKSLKPGVTYHYRLVAKNSSGTTVGEDRAFSTVGAPFSQTGSAPNVGPSYAVVTGTLDTHGRSTSWWFDYGTTTAYGHSTSGKSAGSKAGAQAVSSTLTGLTPSTTYHYRLVTKSDAGTTRGADATFTTSGVTLTVVARAVTYGGRIKLSGVVPTHQSGEQIVIYAQAYGGGSFHSVTTLLSGVGGAWSYTARPQITTSYKAGWKGGFSAPVTIGVHPRISLTRLRNGHFVVRVLGGGSFAHRLVQLQRWNGNRWKTLRRYRLGTRSRIEFKATLPRGRSTLRIALSVNQAGAGFLGGTSAALHVKR